MIQIIRLKFTCFYSKEGCCHLAFCEDLQYWQIDECYFENCCKKAHFNMRNVITDKMAKTCSDIKNEDVNTVSGNMAVRLQRQLWDLMENPEANMVAKTGIY